MHVLTAFTTLCYSDSTRCNQISTKHRKTRYDTYRSECFAAVSGYIRELKSAQSVSWNIKEFKSAQRVRSTSRRIKVKTKSTEDGPERAEKRGREEVQGEGEAGEGGEGGEVEEDRGGQEGEGAQAEGDRGHEGANKKHPRHVQNVGKSQSELWSKSSSEEILVIAWSLREECLRVEECDNENKTSFVILLLFIFV